MKIVRKKKLVIQEEIDTCSDCLYCAYNSFYSCETDSGYDCKLAGKRIIDDYDFNKLLEKIFMIFLFLIGVHLKMFN